MFKSPSDIKEYVLAGKATVTLTSRKTGKHYTYRVTQATEDTGERKDLWFVGLLTGPDNYQYLGVINNGFRTTKKCRLAADSAPVRGFQFFWKHIDVENMPPDMDVRHEGTCGRCGRKLTVPESIDRGIGPECALRM